jgi:hypothetical protein
MKTPEQLAEEFANRITRESGRFTRHDIGCAFFAGYKAAQDQLADASKKVDDHDTSYQQGYLDGVADTQARAVKEDK